MMGGVDPDVGNWGLGARPHSLTVNEDMDDR